MATEVQTVIPASPAEPHDHSDQKQASGGGSGSSGSAVYALGLIGAWIFYIGRAQNLQEGVLGFLKGFVWPVFMVYGLLTLLEKKE